jgi:hypothetical protein
LLPFHCTIEPKMKFAPLIVRVWAAAPATAEEGDNVLMVGTGLLTVKLTALDDPPPGDEFVTTTAYDPATDWSLAPSEILSSVELTYVAVWFTAL